MNYSIAHLYYKLKQELPKHILNTYNIIEIYIDEIISEETLNIILKTDAIIIDNDVNQHNISIIINKLNLYAKIIAYKNKTLVSDVCSIKETDTFFNNSGRVGKNEISIGELDVEKVARTAYELAKDNSDIINIDLASTLISSQIWRKIVLDINEDYPNNIIRNISPIDYALTFNKDTQEILLIHSVCINQILEFFNTIGLNYYGTLYLNNTSQTLCLLPLKNTEKIINLLTKNAFCK